MLAGDHHSSSAAQQLSSNKGDAAGDKADFVNPEWKGTEQPIQGVTVGYEALLHS